MTAICLLMLWVRSGVLEVGVERVVRSASLVLMMGRRDAMRCDAQSEAGLVGLEDRPSIQSRIESTSTSTASVLVGLVWLGSALSGAESRPLPFRQTSERKWAEGGRRGGRER